MRRYKKERGKRRRGEPEKEVKEGKVRMERESVKEERRGKGKEEMREERKIILGGNKVKARGKWRKGQGKSEMKEGDRREQG